MLNNLLTTKDSPQRHSARLRRNQKNRSISRKGAKARKEIPFASPFGKGGKRGICRSGSPDATGHARREKLLLRTRFRGGWIPVGVHAEQSRGTGMTAKNDNLPNFRLRRLERKLARGHDEPKSGYSWIRNLCDANCVRMAGCRSSSDCCQVVSVEGFMVRSKVRNSLAETVRGWVF